MKFSKLSCCFIVLISAVCGLPKVSAQTNYTTPYAFTTVAGSGSSAYGNADGTTTSARFYNPKGVAVDVNGNLFVADTYNHTIRKITPAGVVSTFAGSGSQGSADGTGSAASFYSPSGVSVDTSGNVFVADTFNYKIRKISPTGVVTTFAGSGSYGSADGTGTLASFASPEGVAVDAGGNVYVADTGNNKIRKITPGNMVSTLAGSGFSGSTDGPGTTARFYNPKGVAVDLNGNVFVADSSSRKIRMVTPAGVVTTFAGSGSYGSTDGSGIAASFYGPSGIAVDPSGNFIIADSFNHKIRKITATGVVTTFAGAGTPGSADGIGPAASFNYPNAVAVDANGNLFVADLSNHKIREITPAAVVSIFAGSDLAKDGIGVAASFNSPSGVAADSSGNLFIADTTNNKIRKIDSTGAVTTFAGSGLGGSADGTGTAASFYYPDGLAVDASGNVYVGDRVNNKVRKITSAGVVSTLAGSGSQGSADGTGSTASFSRPSGVAVDTSGNVIVSDQENHKIRKITPAGLVTTFAGSGLEGSTNGSGTTASFYSPQGLAVDASGNVFVADRSNNKIRKITPAGVVTTFAGSGNYGSADGTGTAASFANPTGVAVDASGNVFVADQENHKIRKITPAGVVSTVAGSGDQASVEGSGVMASFSAPTGVAVDSTGHVFVVDQGSNKIRKGVPAPLTQTITFYPFPSKSSAAAPFAVQANASSGLPVSFSILSGPATLDGNMLTLTGAGTVVVGATQTGNASFEAAPVVYQSFIVSVGTETTFQGYSFSTLAGSGYNITFGSADGPGISASFYSPVGVAVDASGNVFVADQENHKIRKITPSGMVTTFAGAGIAGNFEGTGTTARFDRPGGVAVDASGNVYVADTNNQKIRKITPAGVVSTLASSGSFISLAGLAVDASGNVFVADSGSHKIYKITAIGVLSTFAGSGSQGSLDGTGASFYNPNGVALDTGGNVYVADRGNNKIRKITPVGVVTSFAGSGSQGSLDGTGTAATFISPQGIAVDGSGNVWVVDTYNNKIRKITPAGAVSTFAGSGTGSTNGTGSAASFRTPIGVAVDASGNLFVADSLNSQIRKISSTAVVSNFAGRSKSNDGVGLEAGFYNPSSVVADTSGNVYVADTNNDKVRKISPAGVVTTFAGSGISGSADGTSTAASFYHPSGLAMDANANVYVADSFNNKIRKITPAGVVTTLAGSGISGSANGTGTSASFSSPEGLAVDGSSNVYVADYGNSKIRKITPAGVVTTFAGSGASGSLDGTGTAASFHLPAGVAADTSGNVFVADTYSNKIRKITSAGVVTTLAGSGSQASTDGTGTGASFNNPRGLAVDTTGNLFVTDYSNHTIRKITPWGEVTTIGGSSSSGNADGFGKAARFYLPDGVAVDASGNLYIADLGNHRIRKGVPFSGTAIPQTIVFDALPSKVFGDAPFALSASATSSLPVSFMIISGPAIIFGNIITLTGAGTVRVRAAQSGNEMHASAPSVDQSFLITGGTTPNLPVFAFSSMAGSGGKFYGSVDGIGIAASFAVPTGVAVDASGNFYVADRANNKIRKITPAGVVTTFAGSGLAGSTDATGTEASFNEPYSVAVGSNGTLFVADRLNNKIRMISASGDVSTLAGSGSQGSANGTGTVASFYLPTGVAVDMSGNVYVADSYNHKIRKISPAGEVTTLAGSGSPGSTNGTGTAASFNNPFGVAVDSGGNVYVADYYNLKIRKITPAGVVSTLAGSGIEGSSDGTGEAASFRGPTGVTVDAGGNVFVADLGNHKIRKITPAGVVTTLAGYGTAGSVDGTGAATSFNRPFGLTVDAGGNVFVADTDNCKIRKIDTTGVVTTVAGFNAAQDGSGATASFRDPFGVTVDANGNAYVADTSNHKIRKISPAGLVTTFAGSGIASSTDGTGTAASFSEPKGVAVDGNGNVYVADTGNNKIRKISPSGVVTTLAGSGDYGSADGAGTEASFYNPSGVAVDASGNVFVADYGNRRIRKITPEGVVTAFAGSVFGFGGSTDGTGRLATFSALFGLAMDSSGNIYVADTDNRKIRKISPAGVVTTLAGSGDYGSADGTGTAASFAQPSGVAVDTNGNVFVADSGNHKIRRISPAGVVSTLAGSLPYGTTDGIGSAAGFNTPCGVAVDASGTLYIADTGNNRVRKGLPGLTQVITFGPLADKEVSDTTFALSASSSSGLPITFSVLSGPATVSGGIVTLTGSGTIVIRASQVGNVSYAAASAADQSFIVSENSNPVVPLNDWASTAGLSGLDAAPAATPFNDGVSNLLKYAFNMNAAVADVSVLGSGGNSGLPMITIDESGPKPLLKVEFLRRKGSGLVYTPERATTLGNFTAMVGSQTVTSINAAWERVSVVESNPPANPSSAFARVKVTLPQ